MTFTGCGLYCNQCAINGPGLCDPNQCQPGYMFDPASKTCQCKLLASEWAWHCLSLTSKIYVYALLLNRHSRAWH